MDWGELRRKSIIDYQVPYNLGKKLYDASNKTNTVFWKTDGEHIGGMSDHEEKYVEIFIRMLAN